MGKSKRDDFIDDDEEEEEELDEEEESDNDDGGAKPKKISEKKAAAAAAGGKKQKTPASKKVKTEPGVAVAAAESDSMDGFKPDGYNADGEAFFQLDAKKRCTVRKWKDMILIDIREL